MNHWAQRDFLREHARVAQLALAPKTPPTQLAKYASAGLPGPQPTNAELRRRQFADLQADEQTEARVHRAPPAPVNYHEL